MPVESIEITLIFFIMFLGSVSIVYLFSSLQNTFFHNLYSSIGVLAKNSFFTDYILAKYNSLTTVRCNPTETMDTMVVGTTRGVYIQVTNTNVYETINTYDISGVGFRSFYIYNDSGTIRII